MVSEHYLCQVLTIRELESIDRVRKIFLNNFALITGCIKCLQSRRESQSSKDVSPLLELYFDNLKPTDVGQSPKDFASLRKCVRLIFEILFMSFW